MKDRQTPTLHVRDVMSTRARVEGFSVAFIGPTPSLEVLAAGPEVMRPSKRAWPLVEIVDRRMRPGRAHSPRGRWQPSGRRSRAVGGLLCSRIAGPRTRPCGASLVGRYGYARVADPVGPRGHLSPLRQANRPLPHGGTAFEEMGSEPERLIKELNRRLGNEVAGIHPTELPVAVGTERDLSTLTRCHLRWLSTSTV